MYPDAVLDVSPSFNTGVLYPLFAVAIDHTGVPLNTTVFAVTAVPFVAEPDSLSNIVVKLLPVPTLLVTVLTSIVALFAVRYIPAFLKS